MAIRIQIHQSDEIAIRGLVRIKKAIRAIATDYGWASGEISIALVRDDEIHEINREHLNHDYPTDVISFDLTEGNELLEGEIIASVDTAVRIAQEHAWSADDELLLYVIHGMLHIVGLRDKTRSDIQIMRNEETHYLSQVGVHR